MSSEVIKRYLLDRFTYCFSCPEDLDIFRESFVILVQFCIIAACTAWLPWMVISCRTEYCVIYIAFLFCPLGYFCHHVDHDRSRKASDVVAEYSELTHACIVQLIKFAQKRLNLLICLRLIKSSHKRVGCPNETALRIVSDFYHFLDLCQFFFRI